MDSQTEKDILRRLTIVENEIKTLEEKIIQCGINDATITAELQSLRNDFNSLKADVLMTIKDHTDRTWKLIERSWKMIVVLISVIILMVGVKIGPEILKLLSP